MQEIKFELQGDYIELYKLLKAEGIAETGGMAKMMIDDGLVAVNHQPESRKRCKLKTGDVVEIAEVGVIKIV